MEASIAERNRPSPQVGFHRQPAAGPARAAWRLALQGFLLLTLMTQSGCAVLKLADRTLHRELGEYPRVTDGYVARRIYKQWAREAWLQAGAEQGAGRTAEYQRGFEEGFVDFVFAGGNGEPPPVPPRRFWRVTYRSDYGDQLVRDWNDGFRAGAEVARLDGYRQRATLPANVPAPEDHLATLNPSRPSAARSASAVPPTTPSPPRSSPPAATPQPSSLNTVGSADLWARVGAVPASEPMKTGPPAATARAETRIATTVDDTPAEAVSLASIVDNLSRQREARPPDHRTPTGITTWEDDSPSITELDLPAEALANTDSLIGQRQTSRSSDDSAAPAARSPRDVRPTPDPAVPARGQAAEPAARNPDRPADAPPAPPWLEPAVDGDRRAPERLAWELVDDPAEPGPSAPPPPLPLDLQAPETDHRP